MERLGWGQLGIVLTSSSPHETTMVSFSSFNMVHKLILVSYTYGQAVASDVHCVPEGSGLSSRIQGDYFSTFQFHAITDQGSRKQSSVKYI